tara:strand:- start:31 stop:804 length:774 start_codon:yes stop_codon:yes gene_type:complete
MAYQKIVVNTGLSAGVLASDTNHIPALPSVSLVTGTGSSVASGSTTAANLNTLVDTTANFEATTPPLPVVAGDLCFNTTDPGNSVAVSATTTSVLMVGNIFSAAAGGEDYTILRSRTLIDVSRDFGALGVSSGDIVYNTTANTQAVVQFVNGSVLALDVDIFGTLTTFNNSYTVYLSGGKISATVMDSSDCCLLYVGTNTATMTQATQYVDVRVLTCGDTEVIFKNFKVGEYLPVQIKQLFSTGTTEAARESCLAIW